MTSEREKLAGRRHCESFSMLAGMDRRIEYHVTLGWYPDGRLAEVFLDAGKSGTDLDVATREIAVAISIALQYGVPVDAMREACPRRPDGTPDGILGLLLDKLNTDASGEAIRNLHLALGRLRGPPPSSSPQP